MFLRQLFEDGGNHITFCFGRFNPPTIGHKQLFDVMSKQGGDVKIFTSQSQDPKKNPLDYATKIKFLKLIVPEYANNIVSDAGLNTVVKVASHLYNQGYRDATFVAGSDRLEEMKKLLVAYNGVEGKSHGYYKFDVLDFVSSGEREDGAEGVAGVSASSARAAAATGDLEKFAEATGAGQYAKALYSDVRKGMGINNSIEENNMRSKEFTPAEKPRNFVAKNAKMGGAGQHTDKKKAEKQGDVKHKGKEYAEGMAEGRNTNNPVDDMVEDYLDWLGARHMLTKRREEEKAQIMSDLKSGYLHPDDIDYAMSSGQGMAKETGDKPFDNMMKKVTKTPTAKARNTERIRQKREREEETRDRLKGGFGLSPADKLSIREPKESSSGAMANAASRLVNKDDGKVAKLRAAGDKRREDQLKSRNIAKKNEDAAKKDS